jgi:hypothetical protein
LVQAQIIQLTNQNEEYEDLVEDNTEIIDSQQREFLQRIDELQKENQRLLLENEEKNEKLLLSEAEIERTLQFCNSTIVKHTD